MMNDNDLKHTTEGGTSHHKLVIVESPAKAKTISRILPGEYKILASFGHVRDLPERIMGIDIKNNFEPQYEVTKSKVITTLSQAAKGADEIYLATDPDREGEAIAWHLKELLGKNKKTRFRRVEFHEITRSAVGRAFAAPRELNLNLVDSQQARRILDRIVGYQISPLLWSKIQKNISAGRVQSVALRIVCEREREIQNFVPVEYWNLTAAFLWKNQPDCEFTAKLIHLNDKKLEINNQETAERIYSFIKSSDSFPVDSLKNETVRRYAPPPFITSTMQQSAGWICGFSASKTMEIAQQLYEGVELGSGEATGLITYMRTDSFTISKEAQAGCRDYIIQNFGEKYVPEKPNFFKNKSSAQEAHEAIRPTDIACRPDDIRQYLSKDQYNLYKLVWNRFVASQMSPAEICRITADVAVRPADNNKYTLRAVSSTIVFDGFMKVLRLDKKADDENDDGDTIVPFFDKIRQGDNCSLKEMKKEQKFTEPPPRYTEPSLIKELESNGIGRPSTYAAIVNTIQKRKYVTKTKGKLIPEELGFKVNDYLTEQLPDLINIGFTAEMENKLDEIEEGKVKWTNMLNDFYKEFSSWLNNAKYSSAPDKAKVNKLISLMSDIKQWDKPEKRGRRYYNDKKFYDSVSDQFETNGKLTEKQWSSLLSIASKYSAQIPDLNSVAGKYNFAHELDEARKEREEAQAPAILTENGEKTVQALETIDQALKTTNAEKTDAEFIESVLKQAKNGKTLSSKQIFVVKKIAIMNKNGIGRFEEISGSLGITQRDIDYISNSKKKEQSPMASGTDAAEIEPLLSKLDNVKNWSEPEQKGRRTYNDKSFYESLKRQYSSKKTLSPKQIAALKKLAEKY